MKRIQIAYAVEHHVETMLDNDAISNGEFIHVFLDERFMFVFCFNAWVEDYQYKFYEVMQNTANTFADQNINKSYPNISAYLQSLVERIFTARNKENQDEYFNSLTGAGLRQARQDL